MKLNPWLKGDFIASRFRIDVASDSFTKITNNITNKDVELVTHVQSDITQRVLAASLAIEISRRVGDWRVTL